MELKQLEKIAKALSDVNRLKILQHMQANKGRIECMEIADILNLAQPSISHHIKKLAQNRARAAHPPGSWPPATPDSSADHPPAPPNASGCAAGPALGSDNLAGHRSAPLAGDPGEACSVDTACAGRMSRRRNPKGVRSLERNMPKK